ncbi:50S ribosomal protein L7/L12 [Candidatus Peregrinibacteria bacterium CG10_big_fil_rev_8_21_14_0_10_49_10]|nr:MAG: 50S ribosomal protein L7/L12 [Candidatus Peregrinibacteria bacterium CG10_big_fil_rev_8_21_14_0_10_49_10]
MSDDTATAEAEAVKLSKEEKAVIDALEKLNVVQLNNVVKFMESEYGISAAAPVAVAAAPAAGGGDEGGAAEKSSYDIELTEAGGQKIAVIKVVREITGLPLGEAKAAVDNAPKVVKEGVPKEEAETMKKKLEEAGAKVTLK